MNPFDLTGPPFLGFYAVLTALVLFLLHVVRARGEAGDPARVDTSDPYLLAHLRGGANHALSVAVISLIDRDLIHSPTDGSLVTRPGAVDIARRPIEKAILKQFASEGESNSIFSDPALLAAARAYEDQLRRVDLLPNRQSAARRTRLFLLAATFLLLVSGIKLFLAYQRGRRNVLFLVLLTVLAVGVAWVVSHPRLTETGRRFLQDIRVLFAGVKARASTIAPGGGSVELPLLAAIFGLSALPASGFPYAKKLSRKGSSGAVGSSCGSVYGSGCGSGSSCGSGCGGGGGGCGGCGS